MDVFIRYPATSVVDVDAIKQKLVANPDGSDLSGGRDGRVETEKKKIEEDYTLIKILATILSILLLIVLIFILCCCCPSKITSRQKIKENYKLFVVRMSLLQGHHQEQGGPRHGGGHPGADREGRGGEDPAGRQVCGDPQVGQVKNQVGHGESERSNQ